MSESRGITSVLTCAAHDGDGFMESESERGKRDAKIEGSYQKYSNFSKRFDEVHKTLGMQTRINI